MTAYRYYKLTLVPKAGQTFVAISEANFYPDATGGAMNRAAITATATSYYSAGYEPALMLDGDNSSVWHAGSGGGSQDLIFDLGSAIELELITLRCRNSYASNQGPASYDLAVSNDGTTYTDLSGVVTISPETDDTHNVISISVPGSSAKSLTLATKTDDYTLTLADAYKTYVRMNKASANVLTVPTNATAAFPIGALITVHQAGAGQTTIVAASGVTINTTETLKLRKQHSTATLIKVGTNEWDLIGDLEAA